jgi:predicted CopG family antitoxin
MSLSDWLRNKWLVAQKGTPEEVNALLGLADRDLKSCRAAGLDTDWQLGIAYNAALQLATAALAAAGYHVAKGVSHHHYAIQSLAHTVGADSDLILRLDQFRKKRNISDYEQAGTVSEQEAAEMIRIAKKLRGEVEAWLKKEHPELLKG